MAELTPLNIEVQDSETFLINLMSTDSRAFREVLVEQATERQHPPSIEDLLPLFGDRKEFQHVARMLFDARP
jgi:hypothetical protein